MAGSTRARKTNGGSASGNRRLVIVESPAKARTIGGYLGDDYVVESSVGHIRDLPNSAADTPAKIKDKPANELASFIVPPRQSSALARNLAIFFLK